MKKLKMFIASSGELAHERQLIEVEIAKLNARLVERKLFVEPVLWEDLRHHFSGNRIQDYFNETMLECDGVIFLFWKRAGEFTLEEFNTAYRSFKEGGNIKYIYVYFKEDGKEEARVAKIKEQIRKYEQIYNGFRNDAELKLALVEQLRFITEEVNIAGPATSGVKSGGKDKLIAFDLDGTLLRGIVFSWDLVWEKLGFSEEYRRFGKVKFSSGIFNLQDWCDWAVNEFREKKLSKKQLTGIIEQNVGVMKNIEKTIVELKKKGFHTAIVSGGMDIFLEIKIPGYQELFDDVFINRITFDAKGIIQKCKATEYDFDGKYLGVKELCRKYNIKMTRENVYYAGDNYNDEKLLNNKGVTFIAVNPHSDKLKDHAANIIEGDDISGILDLMSLR